VIVVQSDEFNKSLIRTVVVAVVTSNLKLAAAPGNVLLGKRGTGLERDSAANVSQLITVDKSFLTEKSGGCQRNNCRSLNRDYGWSYRCNLHERGTPSFIPEPASAFVVEARRVTPQKR
jgi:mRNA-degrading endonuclease toxin of MazEF toxin-antitoxin module